MTNVTAIVWPPADVTHGTLPQGILDLIAQIEAVAGATLSIATPDQYAGKTAVTGPFIVIYNAFLRGAILAYDAAIAEGYADSEDNFKRYTSEYFAEFVAFRKRWIASAQASDHNRLNISTLRANATDILPPLLAELSGGSAQPTDSQIEQIAQSVHALLQDTGPNKFRYHDPKMLETLRNLKLSREVAVATFQDIMKRDPQEAQIPFYQTMPSVARLKETLKKSPEFIRRFGLTNDEVKTSYQLFLNRDPSADEIERVKKNHPDLASLRKTFLKSPELSREISALATSGASNVALSAQTPLQFKTPPRLQPAKADRVVFLHIPKCGGTTLHNMLCHWFGHENVHPERFNGLYGYPAAGLASSLVFSGHYDHYATTLIPGPKRMISFLRDPIDRLVSLYNFHRAHSPSIIERHNLQLPRWANEHDIDAYFAHPTIRAHPAVNNAIVRYFSDVPQIGRFQQADPASVPTIDEMLEQAIHNVEQFAFVGFMDQYEADMNRLAHTLGCPPPSEVKKHQVLDELMTSNPDMRKISKQSPTDTSRDDMEELVKYDRIFYAHARKLFT